ncbi:hypothetical protein ABZ119_23200 [Streptomyces sp. NPDC006288]|uniref:hypothetical protein n=1 Tax=Streptomyces sp. NPDC006288 TaxID=3156743 RepID=UPI0033B52AB4
MVAAPGGAGPCRYQAVSALQHCRIRADPSRSAGQRLVEVEVEEAGKAADASG